MRNDQIKRVLAAVAEDMEADALAFDGKPFNGRTVAEYFGKHGAAISALAKILSTVIVELENPKCLKSPAPKPKNPKTPGQSKKASPSPTAL